MQGADGGGASRCVQVIGSLFRAPERPGVFVAPGVVSHGEKANGFFAVDAVVDIAKVVVHPAEDQFVVVDGSGGAEIALAGLGFRLAAMGPWSDHRMCAGILFSRARGEQTFEVCRRTVGAVGFVVPAGKIQDRGVDAIVFITQFGPVPPSVGRSDAKATRSRKARLASGPEDRATAGKFWKRS